MTHIVESRIYCWNCAIPIVLEGREWVGGRACEEPGGHWTGCTQDMGLMTDCGEEAHETRDGFPLCAQHAAGYDTLRAIEAYLDAHPEANP